MSPIYLQAILLGIIQGIAEFLPISSSGHIVVFGKLLESRFGVSMDESALLNVALHLGTLGSILVVYRHDLRLVLRDFRLCGWIVLATIPTAVIGVLFKKKLEATFEQPLFVAAGWLMTSAALWYGQRISRNERELSSMNLRDCATIGLCQLASLVFRGFSRSGSTISGGLARGFTRAEAARFSFLLAVPAIGGAGVVKIGPLLLHALTGKSDPELEGLTQETIGALVAGALVSFVVGWASLQWLIRIIIRRGVGPFAAYCLIVALVTFAWQGAAWLGAARRDEPPGSEARQPAAAAETGAGARRELFQAWTSVPVSSRSPSGLG